MVTLDIICFVWICMKKGSMCNHQSNQDWNDLEVAWAFRIEPDGKGTFQNHSISILDVTASIIPDFVLKLKIWRSKRFDWRSWTHTSCSLINFFIPFPPLLLGKAQFISQIVKIAHKIETVFLTHLFYHFTSWLAFELFDISYLEQC